MHRNWHHDFEYSDRLLRKDVGSEDFFKTIEKELPPVVSRVEAARITGGLVSAKTLSNEDALGKGPNGRVRIGSKVGYTRSGFMSYLKRKIKGL